MISACFHVPPWPFIIFYTFFQKSIYYTKYTEMMRSPFITYFWLILKNRIYHFLSAVTFFFNKFKRFVNSSYLYPNLYLVNKLVRPFCLLNWGYLLNWGLLNLGSGVLCFPTPAKNKASGWSCYKCNSVSKWHAGWHEELSSNATKLRSNATRRENELIGTWVYALGHRNQGKFEIYLVLFKS